MSLAAALTIIAVAVILLVLLLVVGLRALALGRELDSLADVFAGIEEERDATRARMTAAAGEIKKFTGWLEAAEQENAWLRGELERRPAVARKTYRIFTLGLEGTGKTSLTLKWANPLGQVGTVATSKKARYERVVSRVRTQDGVTEHVFEVHDLGKEQMVDALAALMGEEVHALLFVVDLCTNAGHGVEAERVKQQLVAFQPPAFQYFLGPKTMAACKTVVLFINKVDVIADTPAMAEETARKLYRPLIDDLLRYAPLIDVRVVVGSARYGHSTHLVFAHFVEKLLPPNTYDQGLLQFLQVVRDEASTAQTAPIPSLTPNGPGETEPLAPLRQDPPRGSRSGG